MGDASFDVLSYAWLSWSCDGRVQAQHAGTDLVHVWSGHAASMARLGKEALPLLPSTAISLRHSQGSSKFVKAHLPSPRLKG